MQFRLSLLFAFMALCVCVLSSPSSSWNEIEKSEMLYRRGGFVSKIASKLGSSNKDKPSSDIKPYTGPGALDTTGGGGGTGNPNIKAFYPTGNPKPETPLPFDGHGQNRNDATAGKEDDYFGNWQAFSKPSKRSRSTFDFQGGGYPSWL